MKDIILIIIRVYINNTSVESRLTALTGAISDRPCQQATFFN